MQMDAGLDTGAMLLKQALPIDAGDTTATLHDRLAPGRQAHRAGAGRSGPGRPAAAMQPAKA
jgi:hypothetical protein